MFFNDVLHIEDGVEIIERSLSLLQKEDKKRQELTNIRFWDDIDRVKEGCAILKYDKYVKLY